MPKLINADALFAKLETMAREQWNHRVAPTSWSHAYLEFADMLDREPDARQTARWIAKEIAYGYKEARCSACGEKASENVSEERAHGYTLTIHDPILTAFCPNCGAKMDGGDTDARP